MLGSRKKFALLTLLFTSLSLILEAAALPASKPGEPNKPPAVYRRYVRRRPPVYADDEFMEEVIEEFYVQKRPPKFALSEDDIELIIKCDLNPEFKDCYKLNTKNEHPMAMQPSTERASTTQVPIEEVEPIPQLPTYEDYDDKEGEEEDDEDEDEYLVDIEPTTRRAHKEEEEPPVYTWTSEEASATEADPNFYEGSGDDFK